MSSLVQRVGYLTYKENKTISLKGQIDV